MQHARRTHEAFIFDGEPFWGVSVFCALDDIGPGSLDGLLRRFATYRVIHLPSAARLRSADFELLPSFGRPHYTVSIAGDSHEEFVRLLEALGPAEGNPYHRGVAGPGRR